MNTNYQQYNSFDFVDQPNAKPLKKSAEARKPAIRHQLPPPEIPVVRQADPTGSFAYGKTGCSDPPGFARNHEEMAPASRQRAGVHSVSRRRNPLPAQHNYEVPRGLHGPAVTGARLSIQSDAKPVATQPLICI